MEEEQKIKERDDKRMVKEQKSKEEKLKKLKKIELEQAERKAAWAKQQEKVKTELLHQQEI